MRGVIFGLARSLVYFAYTACFYYGGINVANGSMNFGDVCTVTQSVIMGISSIATVLAFGPNVQNGVRAARSIYNLLKRHPIRPEDNAVSQSTVAADLHSSGSGSSLVAAEGTAKFDSVDFFYPIYPKKEVLYDMCWEVGDGQQIALVGPSNCGKSTCIQLLLRLYDVNWGQVIVNGTNIREIPLDRLRKLVAMVPQQPTIFARSVMMNIAYGDNTRLVEMDEIINAAKIANAHNFINALPGVSGLEGS